MPPPGAGSAAKIEKFDKPEYDTSKLQLSDCPVTDTHTECRNGIKFLCKPFTTISQVQVSRALLQHRRALLKLASLGG